MSLCSSLRLSMFVHLFGFDVGHASELTSQSDQVLMVTYNVVTGPVWALLV